ncbi:hypothetical protein A2U01_0000346 [Trifolium medium]|uniref:Uncharacterized protein n=1 Tax=Trifolium medium TaxID=97028 RepID=A0A392LYF7_9FABA|nr:hypothetical protein [Trifolium medium]
MVERLRGSAAAVSTHRHHCGGSCVGRWELERSQAARRRTVLGSP